MKINKNLLLVFGVLILALSMVSAMTTSNITIDFPASTDVLSGAAQTYNITMAQTGYESEGYNYTNIWVYSAALTVNTTRKKIVTADMNESDSYNGTFDTQGFEDGADYTVTFEVYNATDSLNTTYTSMVIDNGVPTAATSLGPSDASTNTNATVNFTGTVVDANTTACTLYFDGINPGASSYTMSYSGTSCSYTLSSVPDMSYKWYIQASDGSNTTNSATQTITVDVQTGGGLTTFTSPGIFSKDSNTMKYLIIGIVIVILLYIIAKRKK